MSEHTVSFLDSDYASKMIDSNANLSEVFNASNSPLLFGCRTGICGTCLVEVEGEVLPPSEDEQEVLDIYTDGQNNVRLACQLVLLSDVSLRPYDG
jgi:ferredoxin